MKNLLLLLLFLCPVCRVNAGGGRSSDAASPSASAPASAPAPASAQSPAFVQAPFRLTILKQDNKFLKRCFDRVARGRYVRYKVEICNLDTQPRTVDYSCFCLTNAAGTEYDADTYLSVMREQKWDDLKMRENAVSGLNQRTVRPGFTQSGWIVFEVPGEGSYQLKFRGYLSY